MNGMTSKSMILALAMVGASVASAAWYWPFGSGQKDDKPRLSELMEPASVLIDEGFDLSAEGKIDEAVKKYREAISELDRIEENNPERAESDEFASLKNKRAYVSAAIDTLLLQQARDNAKDVAVTDTTELEKTWAEEQAKKKAPTEAVDEKPEAKKKAEPEKKAEAVAKNRETEKPAAAKAKAEPPKPAARPRAKMTKRQQVVADIRAKDWESALLVIREMLESNPKDPLALNLRAAVELGKGDFRSAERTLDQAIQSNPRDHHAYYNMASLHLQAQPPNKSVARRYYDTGRTYGGPRDAQLEEALKK